MIGRDGAVVGDDRHRELAHLDGANGVAQQRWVVQRRCQVLGHRMHGAGDDVLQFLAGERCPADQVDDVRQGKVGDLGAHHAVEHRVRGKVHDRVEALGGEPVGQAEPVARGRVG